MKSLRAAVVALTALGVVAVPGLASAGTGGSSITTVAPGLSGPRQLNEYTSNKVVVAEADSGEVSSVDLRSGQVKTLLSNLYNPQGVDYANGLLYVAVGSPPPPEEGGGAGPEPGQASAALLIAKPGGKIVKTVDLLAYELKHNPDGQLQEGGGDSLSNPFAVLAQRDRILVADAGANDVLAVNPRTGKVSTFFVPPVVTDGVCADAPNNGDLKGCDPVPTGLAEGPDGLIYVSTLGAFAPDAARVYVLNQRGKVVRVITGLTAANGVAVGRDGAVYVTESIQSNLVKIDRRGKRTIAPVNVPVGVVVSGGCLYSTADSFGFAGPVPGSIVKVPSGAFGSTVPL